MISLAVGVLASGAVDVDRIEFTGLHRVSLDEAIEAVSIRAGDAMPLVDTSEAEESLQKLPWIDNAQCTQAMAGHRGSRDHRAPSNRAGVAGSADVGARRHRRSRPHRGPCRPTEAAAPVGDSRGSRCGRLPVR